MGTILEAEQRLTPTGSGVNYAANATARVPLGELQPIGGMQGGNNYLANLHLAFDLTITKTPAGAATLEGPRLRDIIDSIVLDIPGLDKPPYNLLQNAGSSVAVLQHAMEGRRGQRGDLALTGGAAADAYRLKIDLKFRDPNAESLEDRNILISELREATLRIKWGDGTVTTGIWGANAGMTTGVLRECVATVVERKEFFVGVPFSVEELEVANADQVLPFARRIMPWCLEVPVHAQGLVANLITDAERDLVTFRHDGVTRTDRVDARDLIARWNAIHAKSRATGGDELPDHETNTSPFVPLVFPSKSPWSYMQAPQLRREPKLVVTGTDGSPRLLVMTTGYNTTQRVLGQLARAGKLTDAIRRNPRAAMKLRTPQGMRNWDPRSRATRLPISVVL